MKAQEAVPTVSEIARGITLWQEQIESLEVEFEFASIPGVSADDVFDSLGKVALKDGVEKFAMKGEMRRLERIVNLSAVSDKYTAKLSDGRALPERDRRKKFELRSFNGSEYRDQGKLTGTVTGADDVPPNNFQSMILVNIGLLPESICANAEANQINARFGLPGALLSSPYEVSATKLDGREVLQLSGNIEGARDDIYDDIIWLDAARGYVMVRRDLYHPQGQLSIRFKNDRFREVVDGVWLPLDSECAEFSNDSQSTPVVTNRLKVKHWRINSIQDEHFDLAFRPGTQVSNFSLGDSENPVVYTVPVDPRDLDDVISLAIDGPRRAGRARAIIVACVLAPVVVLIVHGIRKRHLRRGFR